MPEALRETLITPAPYFLRPALARCRTAEVRCRTGRTTTTRSGVVPSTRRAMALDVCQYLDTALAILVVDDKAKVAVVSRRSSSAPTSASTLKALRCSSMTGYTLLGGGELFREPVSRCGHDIDLSEWSFPGWGVLARPRVFRVTTHRIVVAGLKGLLTPELELGILYTGFTGGPLPSSG